MEAEDKPICRFCLEDDDPLIRACRCIGSVAHIHSACLVKWVELNPNPETNSHCNLCLANYTYIRSHEKENIPDEDEMVHYFFTRPWLYLMVTHYFFIFFPILNWDNTLLFYPQYLIAIHCGYFNALLKLVPIKNRNLYMKAIINPKQICHLIVYLLKLLLSFKFYFISGTISTIYLFYFYNQHIETLNTLNRNIIIEVLPYVEDEEDEDSDG
jgi:E3 ubiquitin-protein ligase DOA10